MKTKLAVIGSREGIDISAIPSYIEKILKLENISKTDLVIVSGGARGADQAGESWARSEGIETLIFLAKWKELGKGAGYIRNVDIIKNSDIVLAVWNGDSRGTAHSLSLARKMEKKVYLVNPELHLASLDELPEKLNYRTNE